MASLNKVILIGRFGKDPEVTTFENGNRKVSATLATSERYRDRDNRYVKDVEKELFRIFEKDIRNMTVQQGVLLMRLVDRECGMSGYEIIRTYENGFAATFWQVVAKMFSQDLKSRYDPNGKDLRTEELVRIWDSGEWNGFYYSIFMEMPRRTEIKTERLESTVRK